MMSPKIVISYTATKSQRNRSDCHVKVLCNDSDYNGGPRKTRPVFAEGLTTARAISKEEWHMPQIPVQERERLNDTLDPKVMEHLTWLSKNWCSYFKGTEESSSSATSW